MKVEWATVCDEAPPTRWGWNLVGALTEVSWVPGVPAWVEVTLAVVLFESWEALSEIRGHALNVAVTYHREVIANDRKALPAAPTSAWASTPPAMDWRTVFSMGLRFLAAEQGVYRIHLDVDGANPFEFPHEVLVATGE